jgi:TolB-like protein
MKRYILRTSALWGRGLILALLSVSLFALFTQFAYAMVSFAKTYGGVDVDWATSVQQTSDGGYILAGTTYSFGAGRYDAFLVKTDAYGNISWAKTYGGLSDDEIHSFSQTSYGGYILAGVTYSFGAGIFLVETSAYGNIIWAKTYGGLGVYRTTSVQQRSDGGYILAGYGVVGAGYYDAFLVKTDAYGYISWAKTYGGTSGDGAFSLQQTSDGGYILAGYTRSFGAGGSDAFLVKTDANGNVIWAKTYGGTSDDLFYNFLQTSDGGYILAGSTSSFGAGGSDVFLVKTDANGNIIWAKTYGGTSSDGAFSVQQTSDGGYILAGFTYSFGAGGSDVFLIKTDANGNIIWAKTYGGTGGENATSVLQTSDGGYILAGETNSFGAGGGDAFLIKTDENGDIGSCSIVQNVTPTVNTVSPMVNTPSPSVSSVSLTVNSAFPTDTFPTFAVSVPCFSSISESCQIVSGLITPYKGGIKVSGSGEFDVKVYNVSGGIVKAVKGKNEVKLELSKGVYFVEVVSGNRVLREKVLIR